jgi:CRP/FNR family transcriptional regulator, cyclic AMP receptor protein
MLVSSLSVLVAGQDSASAAQCYLSGAAYPHERALRPETLCPRHKNVVLRRLFVVAQHKGGKRMADVEFAILASAKTRSFAAGETIFREGESGEEFFVIRSGQVHIRSGDRVVETVGEHGIFGELALIDDEPRSATAVAATAVEVVPVERKQFLFLVSETPNFALNLMRVLARRLRAETSELAKQKEPGGQEKG